MRVLLVDDHALFRSGLAGLLRAFGIEVVGQAADGDEAIAKARELHPDLILMDIMMQRRNGLEATRAIKAEFPDITVVIITASDDQRDLFEAIKSGAAGYLLKNVQEQEFEEFLRRLRDGEPLISPALAWKLLQEFGRMQDSASPAGGKEGLSDREQEVLQLAARGSTNRQIAEALLISESTVQFHMKHIIAKLHLRNRAAVIAWAFEHGLIPTSGAAPPPGAP